MVRPKRIRTVNFSPETTYFKPSGVPMSKLKVTTITIDELEALRLKDKENFAQDEASKIMEISQPTFHRLISLARKKISGALIEGTAIKIEGGFFKIGGEKMPGGDGAGPAGGNFGRGFGRGLGVRAGRGGGISAGPEGNCKCPKCNKVYKHIRGQPCYTRKCTECNVDLIRV